MKLLNDQLQGLGPVLVTGGAGYIGGQTVLCLIDAGVSVVVVDNLSTGRKQAFHDQTNFYEGNIGNQAFMAEVLARHDIKSILHFAGSIRVDVSIANPLKYYENNTEYSRRLISAAVDADVERIIFSSTAAVYGEVKDDSPVTESHKAAPLNPYGWSKLMTEQTLRAVSTAKNLQIGILRYFNVAGADPQLRHGQYLENPVHLIGRAINAGLGLATPLEIYGNKLATPDGTGVRDYIHVFDLAQAHLASLAYLCRGQGNLLLNLGYGTGHSVMEVLDSIQRVTGFEVPHKLAAARTGEAASVVADVSLLHQTLDWSPAYDELDIITQSAYSWMTRMPQNTPNTTQVS